MARADTQSYMVGNAEQQVGNAKLQERHTTVA